ncbi:MAG: hypothetical protein KatS3mg043_2216 [Rhodothermaceae bacterium]|nr:MAG: hypothetical protein KatS3mg043_2216 [Rhodothermaceae bacterium]
MQTSALDPDATSHVASWKPPADGRYDVRAFTACPGGTTYSEPFPGTADTKRPEPFGTPQPADETLALGDDIAITFDAAGLPAGPYLLRAEGERFHATRTVMLLK